MFSICESALPCAQRWPPTRELARASRALTCTAFGNGPGGLGGESRSTRSGQMAYDAGCPVGERTQVHQLEPGLWWRWRHRFGHAPSADWFWPSPPMAGTTLRLRHFAPVPSNASNSLLGLACAHAGHLVTSGALPGRAKKTSGNAAGTVGPIRNSLCRRTGQCGVPPAGYRRYPGGRRATWHHDFGLAWHGSGFAQRPRLL